MLDYGRGKIYKIVCNITGLIYIGSTCEPRLPRRLAKHVGNYKEYLAQKRNFVTSFKILEKGNYDIVLIEEYPCETKDQLHSRERFYIESIKCVNKIIPTRTVKEYNEINKDVMAIKRKEYREKNSDKIQAYRDLVREERNTKFECVCGGKYTKANYCKHIKTGYHQKYLESIDKL